MINYKKLKITIKKWKKKKNLNKYRKKNKLL